jgi:hypothetical protein
MVGAETADFLGDSRASGDRNDMLPGIAMVKWIAIKFFLFERFKNYGTAFVTNATVKRISE